MRVTAPGGTPADRATVTARGPYTQLFGISEWFDLRETMTTLLDVTIDGCPTSQRSKVVMRKRSKANGGGAFASLAKDEKTEEWRNAARSVVAAAWGNRAPITEPVKLTIWAVGKRPQGVKKALGTGRYWRTVKPDWDNVGKASDVLVKVGVLRDDVLVGIGQVYSLVAAEGELPHVRMRVEKLDALTVVPHPVVARKRTVKP